jgi:hypothetical protein
MDLSMWVTEKNSGKPLDGNYDITYQLYDQERNGNIIWEETQNYDIHSGVVTTILGKDNPFPEDLDHQTTDYYLGIIVDGDPMDSRKRLSPSLFSVQALYSEEAKNSETLQNKTIGEEEDNIPLLGTGGTLDNSLLNIGEDDNQLVLGDDERLHLQNQDTGTTSQTFNLGSDLTLSNRNFDLTVSSNNTKPTLRYNSSTSRWQISNDGEDFNNVLLGTDITYNQLAEDLLPSTTLTYNIGSTEKRWKELYVQDVFSNSLTISGDINLENTTYANQSGIIYKNGVPFMHNFNYGDNGTVTTVGYNTFLGENAGNFTMGSGATAVHESGYNTIVGYEAFSSNTTGWQNSAIGHSSLFSNTTGYRNIAFGGNSLHENTTGYYNIGLGSIALYYNTTGSNNIAVGEEALFRNESGDANNAIGTYALFNNVSGSHNSAFGYQSLFYNTAGENNVALGRMSLFANSTGTSNSALGMRSLSSNTTGTYNTALGYNSGSKLANGTTGNNTSDYSVFVGSNTKALANNGQNEIVIGYDATGLGSNSVMLGNDSITTTALRGNVGVGTTSPEQKLHVYSSGATSVRFESDTSYSEFGAYRALRDPLC